MHYSTVPPLSPRSLTGGRLSPAESCTDLTLARLQPQVFRPRQHPAPAPRRVSQPRTAPPPPRPPRASRSVGHLPSAGAGCHASSSAHSLFSCSEGCFTADPGAGAGAGQLVTITTGPMVL